MSWCLFTAVKILTNKIGNLKTVGVDDPISYQRHSVRFIELKVLRFQLGSKERKRPMPFLKAVRYEEPLLQRERFAFLVNLDIELFV